MGIFRLFLALSVLLGHTRGHGFFGLSFVFPEIAVQSFFMISGFYMALVLNEKYNQPGQYGLFLKQRFLRLYPTYLILVVAMVLIDATVWAITGQAWGSLKVWHDQIHLFSPAKVIVLVVANVSIFGQDLVMLSRVDAITGAFYFLGHSGMKTLEGASFLVIGPSWTLAVEFGFYLFAPFLVRRAVGAQMAILAVCFLVRAAIYEAVPYDPYHWIYCLFPPNLFFFMAGSLSYLLYRNYAVQLRHIASSRPWLIIIFGLIALDYCRLPYTRQLYLIWMVLVFVMVPLLFALTCKNRLDRLIGELSYPCYLIHMHVLMFTVPLLSVPRFDWLIGPASVALTLALSYLFYRYVELKTERFREGLYKKSLHGFPGRKVPSLVPLASTAPGAD